METRAYTQEFCSIYELRHILRKWSNKGRDITWMGSDEVLAGHRCLKLTEVAAQHGSCLGLVTGNNKDQRPTLNNTYLCVISWFSLFNYLYTSKNMWH